MILLKKGLLLFLTLVSCKIAMANEMEFKLSGTGGNCNGCEWVAAQGEITADTPAKFQEYVAQNGRPNQVALHSFGGNLVAGMALGRLIRREGATTWVAKTVALSDEGLEHLESTEPGVCASACAYAFLGGVERQIDRTDRLGVHQFYSLEDDQIDSRTIQFIAGETLLFTVQMGIDPRVIVAASRTPPEDIYWFSAEELTSLGIDTTGGTIEPWKLEPYKNGLVLTTTQHDSARRSVSVTLFCRLEDRAWRLLISEEFTEQKVNSPRGEILDFSAPNRSNPVVSIGRRYHPISKNRVEFQRIVGDRILISLFLPSTVGTAGGERLVFHPDLARVFNQLVSVSVELPENSWLDAAQENCI